MTETISRGDDVAGTLTPEAPAARPTTLPRQRRTRQGEERARTGDSPRLPRKRPFEPGADQAATALESTEEGRAAQSRSARKTQARAAQSRTAPARAAQSRTAESRAAQSRTAQSRETETRAAQPRAAQARTGQARTVTAPRTVPATPRPAEPRPAAPRPAAPRPAEPRPAALRPATPAGPPRPAAEPETTPRRSSGAARSVATALSPSAGNRTPFIVLLCGLLGGALVSALVINTTLAEGSFEINKLQQSDSALARQRQQLQDQVAQAQSAQVIEQRAAALGMRPQSQLQFVNLKTGKVETDAGSGSTTGTPGSAP